MFRGVHSSEPVHLCNRSMVLGMMSECPLQILVSDDSGCSVWVLVWCAVEQDDVKEHHHQHRLHLHYEHRAVRDHAVPADIEVVYTFRPTLVQERALELLALCSRRQQVLGIRLV